MNRAQRRQAARRMRRAGLPAAAALAVAPFGATGLPAANAQDVPPESAPAPVPAPAEPNPAPPVAIVPPVPTATTPVSPPAPTPSQPSLGGDAPAANGKPKEQKTTGANVTSARDQQAERRDDDARQQPAGGAGDTSLAEPGPAPIGVPNFFIDKFRIPPFLLPIYQAAGTEYGVRWEILAAINEIETDYGRNLNVSSAGAQGWMQFMPATWETYGVDANRDGKKDPYNPVDAIFAAARYLKAAGAQDDLRGAIFAYNHADWYVDSVLMRAKLIGGLPADLVGSLSGLTEGLFPVHARARYTGAVDPSKTAKQADTTGDGDEHRRQIRIYAKPGSPVVAVQDGTVVATGTNERLGRFIRLRDAYGNEYTYGHLGSVSETIAIARAQAHTDAGDGASTDDAAPSAAASTTGHTAHRSRVSQEGTTITAVGREDDDLRPMGGALTALDTLILRTARSIGTGGTAEVALPGDTVASSPPSEDPAPATTTTPTVAPPPADDDAADEPPAVPPTSAPAPGEADLASPPSAATLMPAAEPTLPEPAPIVLPSPPAQTLPETAAPESTPAEEGGEQLPAGQTLDRYFAVDYGLSRDEVELRDLNVGTRVIAGTILGRIGTPDARSADPRNADPHVLFEIRPAGRGAPRIDPKPILDGWKLLESTALYRAKGRNALAAKETTVGQILLMGKQVLQRRVLANPRIQIYPCGRRDISAGTIDRRVLATLEFLAANGLKPTVTSLRCGHGTYTSSGNVSHHTTGTAVDIGAVNGITISPSTQGPGSITDVTVRRLLRLQGTMKPAQIITLRQYPGTDNTLAMADHADHIHIGWRPDGGTATGPVGNDLAAALRPSQWDALIRRLSRIENPRLREGGGETSSKRSEDEARRR